MDRRQPDPKLLLEFALEATWRAGRVTLGFFQTGIPSERKSDNSPVTLADKEAEQTIRDLIENHWPDHGIVGEEYGSTASQSAFNWIIDPIDGTKSFVCGVPLFGTLLALTERGQPLIGVAHFPALQETVYALRGDGCYWNGRRTRVSQTANLSEAVLLTSGFDGFHPRQRTAAWQRLVEATYIQRTWGDAFGYFLVATGQADIMIDPAMNLWDCAPFQVILEEAGGTFTDWKGVPTIYNSDSVATNGILFEPVMAILGER